jgi:hypothetical protein
LDRLDRSVLARRAPGLARVRPSVDVEKFQVLRPQLVVRQRAGEALQEVQIPLEGPRRAMLLRPLEESIDDANDERRFDGAGDCISWW